MFENCENIRDTLDTQTIREKLSSSRSVIGQAADTIANHRPATENFSLITGVTKVS